MVYVSVIYLFFLLMLEFSFVGNVLGSGLELLENQHHLPEYTQLDDYDHCLSSNNGLYCFGTFRIHPNHNNSDPYNSIKEYSAKTYHYDRTIFHRGYCVSSRCAPHPNSTTRFENCVQTWGSERGLNTSLEKLTYCRTQKRVDILNISSQTFILAIFLLLIFNILGTMYDLKIKNEDKNNRFWNAWSIRSNWKQFVEPFGKDSDMTALAPMQLMRVVLLATIILIHVFYLATESFLKSPQWIEKWLVTPLGVFYIKGTSTVQIFYALSCFLTAYNLLRMSKRQQIGLWMLPKQILKRYFRIAPVHLLFVWFGATLYPLVSDGPMWSGKIDPESAICRRKVWAHLLHINNLVEPNKLCLAPTWSLAADIQLQLISLVVTLFLAQYQISTLKPLVGLFVSSCVANVGLAYANNWKPLLHLIKDINLADTFRGKLEESYVSNFYLAPWGSLPACLIGVFLAHVYYKFRQEDFKVYKHKGLRFLCRYSLPLLMLWISAGYLTQDLESPLLLALFVGIERPVFCTLSCLWLFGIISGVRIYPGFKNLSRPIFIPLGRLSLPVLMLHWVIISVRFSSGAQPVVLSWRSVFREFTATWLLSYMLAVPITLLIELPIQNTFTYITSSDAKLRKKEN